GERRSTDREIPTRVAAARFACADGVTDECWETVMDFQSWRSCMKRTLHGLLALIAVFLLPTPNASAQVDRATLSGLVRDTDGGVVPGATVTVTNVATNVESQQVTTETGGYQVASLGRGRYQVEV